MAPAQVPEQATVPSHHTQIAAAREIGVSAYDKVASLLLALFFIVGSLTGVLVLIWFTKQVGPPRYVAIPIQPMQFAGRGDHEAGLARDATALAGEISDTPGLEEEIEEVTEPQISASLEAVTSVVSTQSIALDDLYSGDSVAGFTSIGRGGGLGGSGGGLGDSRPPGPLGEGIEGVKPPWERLELRFVTTSRAAYARQLDRLGIEIGVIGGGEALVDYAFNLSKEKPDRKSGPGHKEKRVYFTHSGRTSQMREWDRGLADAAGIRTEGRYVLQFIPPALQNQLLQLEAQRMGKRRIQEINKTVFGIRESGGQYEIYVIEQTYRAAPRA
jgi:hypothetical protein